MKVDNKYISYLDGFRGYAILFVILSHLGLAKMNIAYLGVTLFFFVSGLLITKLLVYEFNKNKTIGLKDFYLRRLFRLYPALLFMLTVSIAVILLHGYKIIYADILSGLFYFTNYYLVFLQPAGIDTHYLLVSKILWSLSVEEHFYIVFPLLFLALFPKKNKLTFLLAILTALFLLLRIITWFSYADPAKVYAITYYTTHCRADSILYGCLSALLIYRHNAEWYLRLLRSYAAIIIGFILIAVSLLYQAPFFQATFKYTFQGIGFFLIIPSFSFMFQKGLIRWMVDNKLMIFIGRLSYSLYLFHWVALKIGNLNFPERSIYWYASVVLMTIILSLFSYYLVEQPFVGLRKKFGSNARAHVPSLESTPVQTGVSSTA